MDLILERLSVETLATHACSSRVSRLYYKPRDNAMKDDTVVITCLLSVKGMLSSSAQSTFHDECQEIPNSFWAFFTP